MMLLRHQHQLGISLEHNLKMLNFSSVFMELSYFLHFLALRRHFSLALIASAETLEQTEFRTKIISNFNASLMFSGDRRKQKRHV